MIELEEYLKDKDKDEEKGQNMNIDELREVWAKKITETCDEELSEETKQRLIASAKHRPGVYAEGRPFPELFGCEARWSLLPGAVGVATPTINLGEYARRQMRYNLERDFRDTKFKIYDQAMVDRIGLQLCVSAAFLAPRGSRKGVVGQRFTTETKDSCRRTSRSEIKVYQLGVALSQKTPYILIKNFRNTIIYTRQKL